MAEKFLNWQRRFAISDHQVETLIYDLSQIDGNHNVRQSMGLVLMEYKNQRSRKE